MKNLIIVMTNPTPTYLFRKMYESVLVDVPMKTKEFNQAVKCAAGINKVLKAHKATMSLDLFRSLIETGIDSYEDNTKQAHRKFNLGYKRKAVEGYKASTRSMYDYAKNLGVNPLTLQLWVSQYDSGLLTAEHAVAFSSTRSGVLNSGDVKVVRNA